MESFLNVALTILYISIMCTGIIVFIANIGFGGESKFSFKDTAKLFAFFFVFCLFGTVTMIASPEVSHVNNLP